MNWTQDQIAAVIGTKELEIISLRMQLAQALERLKKYEPQEKVVPIKEAEDGAA